MANDDLIQQFKDIVTRYNRICNPYDSPFRVEVDDMYPGDTDASGRRVKFRCVLTAGRDRINVTILPEDGDHPAMAMLLMMTKIRDFPVGDGRMIFNLLEAIDVSLSLSPDPETMPPTLGIAGVSGSMVLNEAGPQTLAWIIDQLVAADRVVSDWLDRGEGLDYWSEFVGDPELN